MFDSSTLTRYIAAGSPYTPVIVLVRLSADQHESVRRRVAENKHTPLELLKVLLKDPCPDVRAALVDNEELPEDLLAKLVCDSSCDVRYAVAENVHIATEWLRWLCHDANPYVADRAARSLSRVEQTLQAAAKQQAESLDTHSAEDRRIS